jgi:hypothetical protein
MSAARHRVCTHVFSCFPCLLKGKLAALSETRNPSRHYGNTWALEGRYIHSYRSQPAQADHLQVLGPAREEKSLLEHTTIEGFQRNHRGNRTFMIGVDIRRVSILMRSEAVLTS